MNSKQAIDKIMRILNLTPQKFYEAKTSQGMAVKIDGELELGAPIYVATDEGMIPAPDGTHMLEDGSEILVIGFFLRLIFFQLGQDCIELNVQIIRLRPVKLDRIELAILVLLDIIEEGPDFFERTLRIPKHKNYLENHQNDKQGNHEDSPGIKNGVG